MNDTVLKKILGSTHTIASVGVSSNPSKDSHAIVAYLQSVGYRIIPVNPTVNEILGEKTYPNLTAIREKIDVVQLFRRSEDVPPIVDEAIRVGAKVVWMQVGIWNETAAQTAEAAGLQVVMDHCMRAEHRRLFG